MSINEVNVIVNIVLKVAIVVLLSIFGFKLFKFITSTYKEVEKRKLENEKIKLYSTIDPKLVREEIINYIRNYAARYMTKYIMVNHITYIKQDQIDEMVKNIIRNSILDMSDLYVTYCKILYDINDEEDLIKVIYHLTVDVVLDVVTTFNKEI